MGQPGRKTMEAGALVAIEAVTGIGVNVAFGPVMTGQRATHRLARACGNRSILSTPMQHDRALDRLCFGHMVFDSAAVVANRDIHVDACRGQKCQPAAKAEADHADLAAASIWPSQVTDGSPDVFGGLAEITAARQFDTALDSRLVIIELYTGFQSPENIRRQGHIPLFRVRIAHRPDVIVNAEDLLQDDHRGATARRRPCQIGGQTGAVGFPDNHFFSSHRVVLLTPGITPVYRAHRYNRSSLCASTRNSHFAAPSTCHVAGATSFATDSLGGFPERASPFVANRNGWTSMAAASGGQQP